jgi:CubicO group peptidase (beta-lactamase class C family)
MCRGRPGSRSLRLICAALLLGSTTLAQGAKGQTGSVCGMPMKLDDGWTIASPDSVGMDGAQLCGIEHRLALRNSSLHAVVIARHGKLVFEQYFSGLDQPWGRRAGSYEFDATIKHDMRSVSKSVTSLLVGIAIDRRLIASVNEPVVKFFPEHSSVTTEGWDNVTLRHLLTMTGYFGGTLFYGYQWWLGRSLSNGREVKWVAALGWGGQRIFVVPEFALVVMMTAAQYGEPNEGLAAQDLLANLIIPAVTDPR